MKRVQEILYKSGVKRVFRVVGNIVSKMQFDRVQKEANADYETIEVKTIEDALKMI
jgi:chaperonin cofactor prefoldin